MRPDYFCNPGPKSSLDALAKIEKSDISNVVIIFDR